MGSQGVGKHTFRVEDARIRVTVLPALHGDAVTVRLMVCNDKGAELVSWDRVIQVGESIDVGPLNVELGFTYTQHWFLDGSKAGQTKGGGQA